MDEVKLDKSRVSYSETHAVSELLKNMDGEDPLASSRDFCPQFGSILPISEKETVVMKCKTCAHKVNAKSKFGIYVFIVETGACKVVCGPLDLRVIYKRGRRSRDVAKEAVGEEADA